MLRISNLKISINEDISVLKKLILKKLKIKEKDLIKYTIYKESIDARRGKIDFVYTVDVDVKNEEKLIKANIKDVIKLKETRYIGVQTGEAKLKNRPVIIGSEGPAGLFYQHLSARRGYNPLLLERGLDVDQRTKDIYNFWTNRKFKNNSNVQFGEGGAGTFSDGKLTYKDKGYKM